MKFLTRLSLVAFMLVSLTGISTADALSKADTAVANILFDFDGSDQFASYRVNDDGFVEIVFARNMPDKIYAEILNQLQNHPDISGVLAGKGGPSCEVDSWQAEGTVTNSIPEF